jgi:hypothetical protein
VRSCQLAQFARVAWYRKSTAWDQSGPALRIRDLAHARLRFGYQRIAVLLWREGWPVNRKGIRRLYRLQGLQMQGGCAGTDTCACTVGQSRLWSARTGDGVWTLPTMRCSTGARFGC